jgi:hypothetical protein
MAAGRSLILALATLDGPALLGTSGLTAFTVIATRSLSEAVIVYSLTVVIIVA